MRRANHVTSRMFYYRDLMKKHMKKKELEALLEHNKQEIPVGEVKQMYQAARYLY